MTEYKYPELKSPPPPTFAVLDLDVAIFSAASACQQVWYIAKTSDGKEVARFDSASQYKNWIEVSEQFGMDMEWGFDGDFSTLERHTEYEYKDIEYGYKSFDNTIKEWLNGSGCNDWIGYVSKATGAKNFRYEVSTIFPYKGNRKDVELPKYLEAIRRYARQQNNIKVARGHWEVDDVCASRAMAKKHKGCIIANDKDAAVVRGCYYYLPNRMEEPMFSSSKIVGNLWMEDKKVRGHGYLFLLWQCIAGDRVDGVLGCKGIGDKGAYKALEEFDGVCISHIKEAVTAACRLFEEVYGYDHTYDNCWTGEAMTVTWKEVMKENLTLVYMLRHKEDVCPLHEIIDEVYEELQ